MEKKKKKQSKQTTIALVILFLILVFMGVMTFLWLRKPPLTISNPPGSVGNTAGNLNNYGLFCEKNGKVYFSNSFDGGALYSMNTDETGIERISNSVVQTLLSAGDYLYYFQSGISGTGDISKIAYRHGFFRMNLKDKKMISLAEDVVITGQLINDYVYLVSVKNNSTDFSKIRCDKTTDPVSLASYVINPACVQNGTIYYNGTQDNHFLYALDTNTDIPRQVLDISMWYPVIDNDYLYYMDVANNYRLSRYNMVTMENEVLTDDRIDCFNVGSGYIYYQKNGTDAQLKCMRTDGTDVRVLANGNFTRINMTSKYVYFQDYESRTQYHCAIGSSSYSLFSGAQSAVPSGK